MIPSMSYLTTLVRRDVLTDLGSGDKWEGEGREEPESRRGSTEEGGAAKGRREEETRTGESLLGRETWPLDRRILLYWRDLKGDAVSFMGSAVFEERDQLWTFQWVYDLRRVCTLLPMRKCNREENLSVSLRELKRFCMNRNHIR